MPPWVPSIQVKIEGTKHHACQTSHYQPAGAGQDLDRRCGRATQGATGEHRVHAFIHHHVAAMPDVHLGIGATIGSAIATHKAIIPAAVGVDIGCGRVSARLSISANDIDEKSLKKVFDLICRDVPVGSAQHHDDRLLVEVARPFEARHKSLTDRHPQLLKAFVKFSKWTNQMGTLGGGNHFIEVCLDESSQVWVMLHSGSRGISNAIADYFIQLARKDMER